MEGGQGQGHRREQDGARAGGQRSSWRLVMQFEDWRRYFERFEAGGIHLFCLSSLSSSKRHWLHSWPITVAPPTEFSPSSVSASNAALLRLSASPDRGRVKRRRNPSIPAIFKFTSSGILERPNQSQFYKFLTFRNFVTSKFSETT